MTAGGVGGFWHFALCPILSSSCDEHGPVDYLILGTARDQNSILFTETHAFVGRQGSLAKGQVSSGKVGGAFLMFL